MDNNFYTDLISKEEIEKIVIKIKEADWKEQEIRFNGASFILTESCNLNCVYCYENAQRQAKKIMTPEVAISAVEFLLKGAKLNNRKEIQITFFGGEPTLNIPIMNLIYDYAVYRGKQEDIFCDFTIITNGTIFNEDLEKFYRKWYNTTHNLNIQLSVDGIPEVQNVNRPFIGGAASSTIIEENIKKYLKLIKELNAPDYSLHVHSVINRESINKMYESYQYFLNLGIQKIWFMPCHEDVWEDEHIEIFRSEKEKIADFIYNKCIEENSANFLGSYASLEKCLTAHPSKPCGVGCNFCSITTDGKVYPCHTIYFNDKERIIGDVLEGIDDIESRRFFLDYTSSNLFGDMPCEECSNYSCYRCLARNYANNGNYLIGFPQYCKLSRTEDEIRQNLRNKLISKGLIAADNSCNLENSNDSADIDRKATIKVLEELDKKLYNLEDNFIKINSKIDALIEINNILSEALLNMLIVGENNGK